MKNTIKGTTLLTTGICVLTTACMVSQAYHIDNKNIANAAEE